ncbi:chemotaxis protein CheB [Lysobacter sp. TAB13]|uniref:chemotaxis protein CheB n=1 Tax=Lysobacter sp. TAB13 TaxID=3233065 RepID=UPI003F95A922
MAEAERRVVLLARAGVACERLRGALVEAGANLVLEGDPTVLDPAALDSAEPDVVVVVLDPAAEDALDRFENVLIDPSIEVIFEEAELAASREGWDAARWARHLSAKLNRHDDVLPPGREPEPEAAPVLVADGFQRPQSDTSPLAQEPVAADVGLVPLQQVEAADASPFGEIEEIEAVEAFEAESFDAADAAADDFHSSPAMPPPAFDAASVEPASDPSSFAAAEQLGELARVAPTGSAGDRILSEPPPLPDEAREFFARQALGTAVPGGDTDFIEIDAYPADEPVEELTAQPAAFDDKRDSDFDFEGLTLEAVDKQSAVPGEAQPYSPAVGQWVEADHIDTGLPALDEAGLGDLEVWRAPAPNQVQELVDLDASFAAEGARIDFDATHRDATPIAPIDFDDGRGERRDGGAENFTFESGMDFDLSTEAAPLVDRIPVASAPPVPDWSFSDEASLVSAATGQSGAHGAASMGKHDLDEIERRISGLELVDDRLPASTRSGAVLVLAGIGGPDAVRQLLGALPENFDRPVLVQQRLDGGRYDKLVAQMQRATSVLVKLAEPGSRTIDGVIYILPAGVGIEASDNGIQFVEGGDVLEALPASDSAVLLFSGADPGQVDAAMKLSAHGALIAGQAPDGCYDAAAASAAIARGAGHGQPADLAAKLAARWSRQSSI